MKFLTAIVFLLSFWSTAAQQVSNKKLSKKKLIEQADYYFFKEDFAKALELYAQILDQYPKSHYTQYHQYVAYHLTQGRGESLENLIEFERSEGQTDKFYNYWLGRLHYMQYEFDIARQHFQAFDQMDVYKTREIKQETQDYLEKIEYAQIFYLDPTDYEIIPLPAPINSTFDDLSPAFFKGHNELLFVSSRHDDPSKNPEVAEYTIFHTYKNGNNWNQPSALTELGSLNRSNAKIEVVNSDGKLFIYRDQPQPDLYFSETTDTGWTTPSTFDSKIKEAKIESHFFINDNENRIYFAARHDGSDLDLFFSTLDEQVGTWSDPQLVFGQLNSDFNEDSPFLSHDSKYLYFSSDRPASMGGYDVFRSEYDEQSQSWSAPANMGFPINTIDDEVHFQLNQDNISGFFSSNRLHGLGQFDIYYFHKIGKVLASGKIIDQATTREIPNLQIAFHPAKYTDEAFVTRTDENGNYQVEIIENEDFLVEISLNGQVIYTEVIKSENDEHKKAFNKDFSIEIPEFSGKPTNFGSLYQAATESSYTSFDMLGSKFQAGQKVIVKNIYFDLHSYHLQGGSFKILDQLDQIMIDHPTVKIEIGGHTCNIGTHEVNESISLKRAQSVKQYLVNNGISTGRLVAKGYGETRPLASNDDEEGGRELNRRIELRVY